MLSNTSAVLSVDSKPVHPALITPAVAEVVVRGEDWDGATDPDVVPDPNYLLKIRQIEFKNFYIFHFYLYLWRHMMIIVKYVEIL